MGHTSKIQRRQRGMATALRYLSLPLAVFSCP
jgi:hypothetical protein